MEIISHGQGVGKVIRGILAGMLGDLNRTAVTEPTIFSKGH